MSSFLSSDLDVPASGAGQAQNVNLRSHIFFGLSGPFTGSVQFEYSPRLSGDLWLPAGNPLAAEGTRSLKAGRARRIRVNVLALSSGSPTAAALHDQALDRSILEREFVEEDMEVLAAVGQGRPLDLEDGQGCLLILEGTFTASVQMEYSLSLTEEAWHPVGPPQSEPGSVPVPPETAARVRANTTSYTSGALQLTASKGVAETPSETTTALDPDQAVSASTFVFRPGTIGLRGMVAADVADANVFGGTGTAQDWYDLIAAHAAAATSGQRRIEFDCKFAPETSPTGLAGSGGYGVCYIPAPANGTDGYDMDDTSWWNHGGQPGGDACTIEAADGAHFPGFKAFRIFAGKFFYSGTTSPNGAPFKLGPADHGGQNPIGMSIECGRFHLGNVGAGSLPMISANGGGGAGFIVVNASNEFFTSSVGQSHCDAPLFEVIDTVFVFNPHGPVAFQGNMFKSSGSGRILIRMASPASDGDNVNGGFGAQNLLFGGAPVISKYQLAPVAPTSYAIDGTEVTLEVSGAAFTQNMVGSSVVNASATSAGNDGTFVITSVIDAENLTYENASGVSEAGAGTTTLPDIPQYIIEGGNPEALGGPNEMEYEWSSDRSTIQSISSDEQLVLGRIGVVDTSGGAVVVTLPDGHSWMRSGFGQRIWVDGANDVTFRSAEGNSLNGVMELGGDESDDVRVGPHTVSLYVANLTEANTWILTRVSLPVDAAVPDTVASGAMSLASLLTKMTTSGAQAYSLADGLYEGQRKVIRCTATDNTGTLTPATFADGATAAFDAVDEQLELAWHKASGWNVILNIGGVVIA